MFFDSTNTQTVQHGSYISVFLASAFVKFVSSHIQVFPSVCFDLIPHILSDLDPIPAFNVSVNRSSKSINITVEHGKKVRVRLCYKKSAFLCIGVPDSLPVTVSTCETFISIYSLLFVHTSV